MKQDDDKIDYLLAGKIAGTLDNTELIEIDTLIAEDNTIHERWLALNNALPSKGINDVEWADLTTILQKPKNNIRLFKKLAVAAILTGVCVSAYLYFPKSQQPVNTN